MATLWLKAFHIVFVVTWFAGLFYLPRLFVYFVEADSAAVRTTLSMMQRRLMGITHIGAALALGFGLWLLLRQPALMASGWLGLKLLFVALLIAYHCYCARLARRLGAGHIDHSGRFLRLFNEVPAVVLLIVVPLAVVRPF